MFFVNFEKRYLSPDNRGYFISPTIISGLKDDHKCMQDEIFGPVTCLTIFDTEEEVVERINNTRRV